MYLLDTNVVSMLDQRRHAHARELVDWIQGNGAYLFLSVMTVTELDAGVLKLRREGKVVRAREIARFTKAVLTQFGDRVLALDIEAARLLARLTENTHKQPVSMPDLIIAATAARHGLILLTRNMKQMKRLGVSVRDPFVDLPDDV